jgi:hypothetical protein
MWRRESVAAPRYLYDPERKTRDGKSAGETLKKCCKNPGKKRLGYAEERTQLNTLGTQ